MGIIITETSIIMGMSITVIIIIAITRTRRDMGEIRTSRMARAGIPGRGLARMRARGITSGRGRRKLRSLVRIMARRGIGRARIRRVISRRLRAPVPQSRRRESIGRRGHELGILEFLFLFLNYNAGGFFLHNSF